MPAFASPNFTQCPNDLFEMVAEMGLAELKVTLIAVRDTFGYHRDRRRIKLTEMMERTGLSRQGVLDGAEAAEKRGTLSRIQDGGVTEWLVNVVDPAMVYPVDPAVKPVDQESLPSRPPSVKQNIKQNTRKKKAEPEKPARPPNPLFEAIAKVTGTDITVKSNGSYLGKVCAELSGATPPYTEDEVFRYEAIWWAEKWHKSPPTLNQLQREIGRVRANGHSKNGHSAMPVLNTTADILAEEIRVREAIRNR